MGVVRVACRVRVVGGIAFSTLGAGIVTPPTLADVCAQTVGQLSGVPLMFVADFRRPSWAMRVVDLNAFFDDCSPEVEPPAALVVSPDDYRLFRAHAWDVAQGGILRKVFTDYPQAVAWTLRRRALVSPAKTVP